MGGFFMGELSNCPRCDTLFMKSAFQPICRECKKEEDSQFHIVREFIRKKENRTATLAEVTENTGVPEKRITQFVREGRLLVSQMPNFGYPCDQCGKAIQKGKICEACQKNLQNDLKQVEQSEKNKKNSESHTYYTLDKDK